MRWNCSRRVLQFASHLLVYMLSDLILLYGCLFLSSTGLSIGDKVPAALSLLWTYIAGGEVIEGMSNGVKTVSFKGHSDSSSVCARWGPSYSFSVLVERAEYVRCWERMRSKPWQFIILRGTKGIGKSVFIFWLIYKLVEEARAGSGSKGEMPTMPTFMLISSGSKGKTVYHLLSVVNGTPLVQRVRPEASADYVLSDVEYDPSVVTTNWNLDVVSFGAESEPDVFTGKVEDAKKVSYRVLCHGIALVANIWFFSCFAPYHSSD